MRVRSTLLVLLSVFIMGNAYGGDTTVVTTQKQNMTELSKKLLDWFIVDGSVVLHRYKTVKNCYDQVVSEDVKMKTDHSLAVFLIDFGHFPSVELELSKCILLDELEKQIINDNRSNEYYDNAAAKEKYINEQE